MYVKESSTKGGKMNQEKYPKLNSQGKCAFPKRDNCNFDDKKDRCKYMKYNNSKSISDPTRWECTYKKE